MNDIQLDENQGIAFTNKKTNNKQPDFKGEIQVCGKRLALAVWQRVSQNGNKFLSLMVEEPRKKPAETPKPETPEVSPFDLDDDINF